MTKISNQYSLTNVLFADAVNGRVGIGTTSPGKPLEVYGPTLNTAQLKLFGASSTNGKSLYLGGYGNGSYITSGGTFSNGWVADIATTAICGIQFDSQNAESNIVFSTTTTNNAGPNERMRIAGNGNVGIGTSSPATASGSFTSLDIRGNTGSSLVMGSTATLMSYLYTNASGMALETTGTIPIIFNPAGTERMRITSGGNVGIGTTSPVATLSMPVSISNSQISTGSIEIQSYAVNNAWIGDNIFFNGSAFVARNTGFVQQVYFGTSGITFLTGSSSISAGAASNATERMRITTGGYLKVANNGTYWFPTGTQHELNQSTTGSDTVILRNTSAVPYGMYMYFNTAPNNTTQYFIECSDGANTKISLYSNGSIYNRTGTYAAYSDIKLKENIVDATPKLDDLLKVKIRNYNLIGDELKQIGVIAQELEEIFPNMIDNTVDKDTGETTKGVKYSIFIPMLIKGLQEQQLQINELKALLNA